MTAAVAKDDGHAAPRLEQPRPAGDGVALSRLGGVVVLCAVRRPVGLTVDTPAT